jgi:hypothetical protein
MLKNLLAFTCLAISISVNAAIIDLGAITRDTDTGLDWLDVTQTSGLSYDQVTVQLGVGGDYEGFRYATLAELDQLITNFGYTAINTDCDYTALHCDWNVDGDNVVIETMIKTLGDTLDQYLDATGDIRDVGPDGAGFTWGMLGSTHQNAPLQDVALILDGETIRRDDGTPYADSSDWVSTAEFSVNNVRISRGSFLVTPSAVPIPAAGWLFMSALACLFGKKHLQKNN